MVVSTLADPTLRDKVLRMCELSRVPAVDLLGPTLDGLASFLGRDAAGVPMRGVGTSFRAPLGDAYYRRIKAVEFALKADDGKAPWVLSVWADPGGAKDASGCKGDEDREESRRRS